jgi:hypothetical protein
MFPIGVSRLRIVFDDEIVSFDLTAALGRFSDRFDVQSGERRKAASEVFMKFKLGCELAYKVVAETVFIFNVQVAFLVVRLAVIQLGQRLLDDDLAAYG